MALFSLPSLPFLFFARQTNLASEVALFPLHAFISASSSRHYIMTEVKGHTGAHSYRRGHEKGHY